MALFSGSSSGNRRPLGARPFSGRESSALAPALHPHGDTRRATAAPFQAIAESHAVDVSVSLATPSALPVTSAVEVEPTAEFAPREAPLSNEMPVMAPSVLRVDDIRSEPFGWGSVTDMEPVTEPEPVAAFEVTEAVAEPVIEAAVEAPELAAEPTVVAEALAAEVTADSDDEAPIAFADESAWHDAASLEPLEVEAATSEESPVSGWFANEAMHTGDEPEASWAGDDVSVADIPVSAPWTDLAETVEAPTLETEAIDETEVEDAVAAIVQVPDEPVEVVEAVAIIAFDVDATEMTAGSEAITSDDAAMGETVPDESWWSAPVESVAPVALEADVAPAPRTPPVDGLAALEALVHETQGAERAVEALEAVARMIRSREIVVSVGAGASAESVLASILASLLSHPS
ncbi:MAG: hypothetical protein H7066_04375 [Cytophagaceae bacterium]|nr:hypothetical protein [Gemmatimonadaceae bacterium]